jgi:hypothetical protein
MKTHGAKFCAPHPILSMSFAVGFLVFGLRALIILRYGVDVPFWDQWDAEFDAIFQPILQGQPLSFSELLRNHNEHRPFLTRVFSLTLFLCHGHWSPLVEMMAQSLIPSVTAAFVFHCLSRDLPRSPIWLKLWVTVLCFSHPTNHENMLWGFQNGFYLTVLFLCVAFRVIEKAQPIQLLHVLSICLLGLLAQLCLASGFIVVFLATAIMAYRLFYGDEQRVTKRALFIGLGFAATLLLYLSVARVAHHEPFKAQSIPSFLHSVSCCLGWPNWPSARSGLVLWALFTCHMVLLFKRRKITGLFYLALAGWCLLIALASALKRGGLSPFPAPRYGDFLTLIYLPLFYFGLNFHRSTVSKISRVLLPGSVIVILAAATIHFIAMMPELEKSRERRQAMIAKIQQAYVNEATGQGLKTLKEGQPAVDLCYPDAVKLWSCLQTRPAADYLPRSIRRAHSAGAVKIPERLNWLVSPLLPWFSLGISLLLFCGAVLSLARKEGLTVRRYLMANSWCFGSEQQL